MIQDISWHPYAETSLKYRKIRYRKIPFRSQKKMEETLKCDMIMIMIMIILPVSND